ncbi:hypothetical protein PHMEG_00036698, partial [Phytophthora megakarya]
DITSEMEREVDRIALTFQTRTARLVWEEVNTQFYQGLEVRVVQGLTRDQVLSRVHRVGRVQFGSNIHGVVEVPGLSLVTGTQLTSIDGTFRAVPRPFHRCVIVMVRDAASRVFVPVFYNLTTNRTAPTYRRLLRFINDAADQQLQPGSIVVDFEQALIDSVQRQFTEAHIVGCLFHWKQALRRRLGGLRMPQCPHPSLPSFVGTIDALSQRYVQLLIDITNRRATAPAQLQILLPEPVQLIPTATRGRRSSVRARSRRPRRGRGGRANCATTTVNRTNAHSRRSTRNVRNTTSS